MATVTMKPIVQAPARLDSSAATASSAGAAQATSPENGVWRGDWITFKIWVAAFLIMLVINVWDMIAGLFR